MKDVKLFADLIENIKFAMLTTVSAEDGVLRSRPMTLQQIEFDGDLWFFCGRDTPAARDIEEDGHVNLAFVDMKRNTYISASGHVEVVQDRRQAEQLWNPMYKAWFPKGLEDPELCLLKVHIESVDYWDSPSSPLVHLAGFAKAIATGKQADVGDRGHLNMN